jgi:hypothetical protein
VLRGGKRAYVDDLPPPLHHGRSLFRVRELLAQADHGAVVGLVDVCSVQRAPHAGVVGADAVPVRRAAAHLVAEDDDAGGAGAWLARFVSLCQEYGGWGRGEEPYTSFRSCSHSG